MTIDWHAETEAQQRLMAETLTVSKILQFADEIEAVFKEHVEQFRNPAFQSDGYHADKICEAQWQVVTRKSSTLLRQLIDHPLFADSQFAGMRLECRNDIGDAYEDIHTDFCRHLFPKLASTYDVVPSKKGSIADWYRFDVAAGLALPDRLRGLVGKANREQPESGSTAHDGPIKPEANDCERMEVIASMTDAPRKAIEQHDAAVELLSDRSVKKLTDDVVFDAVVEAAGDINKLPSRGAWKRSLRTARKRLGEQKNQPRTVRKTGKSVIREDEI